MKTAHRKELETNYLADQINRLVEGKNPHAPVWLAILVVSGLILLGYWAVPRRAQQRVSLAWQELARTNTETADSPQFTTTLMEDLAYRERGTPIVPSARFAQACAELELAQRHIHHHEAAERHLDKADSLFRLVLAEPALPAEVRLRCRLGLAQVAETRFWLDKARLDEHVQKQRLQMVIQLYQEALQTAGVELRSPQGQTHPLLQHCQERIRQLQEENVIPLTLLRRSEDLPSVSSPVTPPSGSPQSEP